MCDKSVKAQIEHADRHNENRMPENKHVAIAKEIVSKQTQERRRVLQEK
jgi:hypothetical protein